MRRCDPHMRLLLVPCSPARKPMRLLARLRSPATPSTFTWLRASPSHHSRCHSARSMAQQVGVPVSTQKLVVVVNYSPGGVAKIEARSCVQGDGVPFSGSMETYALKDLRKAESPAAERNKQPILDVLLQYIPASSQGFKVLEVASGSGQHVSHFAQAYPGVTFQPSDCTSEMFGSIMAYCHGLSNVQPPMLLDCTQPTWEYEQVSRGTLDAVMVINMTHISPWEATTGLLEKAGRLLKPQGLLFVYGPFKVQGQHTSESNAAFDASLQARNPLWGYRDTENIKTQAAQHSLVHVDTVTMPANNFMLIFRRASD